MKKITLPPIPPIIERNVQALLNRKKRDTGERSQKEKLIDAITAFTSSLLSIYFHFILFGIWFSWNEGWLGLVPFDAHFIGLATFAAVEAIFLTTFVLIGQKRLNEQTEKWTELNLQVSLLTEHEVTRMMNLVTAMARKLDIKEANSQDIIALSTDIHPDNVLDAMEEAAK